jgi:hypothetical protein
VIETHEQVFNDAKPSVQSASSARFLKEERRRFDISLRPNQDPVANPSYERAHCMIEKEMHLADEEKRLGVPIVRRQRPAMAEHDGLTRAPVFIIDVNISSVFFSNRDDSEYR